MAGSIFRGYKNKRYQVSWSDRKGVTHFTDIDAPSAVRAALAAWPESRNETFPVRVMRRDGVGTRMREFDVRPEVR